MMFAKLKLKIREKMDAWAASNEAAAERHKAQRLLLESARNEMIENERAIARADTILLRDRLAKLDDKIEEFAKKG